MFNVVSTAAWPISCAITLPGTPLSCDQDEYVRRNVSQVARGSCKVLHAGNTTRRNTLLGDSGVPNRERAGVCDAVGRNTLLGDSGVPNRVANTSAFASEGDVRCRHSATRASAVPESGICRCPASVFGVLTTPS